LLKNDGQKFLEMMEQLAERRMQREEEAAADVEEDSEEDSEDDDGSDVDDGEDGEGGSEDEEDEEDEDEEVGVLFVLLISFFLCMLCLWAGWESAVTSYNALRWMTGKKNRRPHSSFQLFLVLSEISMMLTGFVSFFLPLPPCFPSTSMSHIMVRTRHARRYPLLSCFYLPNINYTVNVYLLGGSSVIYPNRFDEIHKLLTTPQPLVAVSDSTYTVFPPYVLSSPEPSLSPPLSPCSSPTAFSCSFLSTTLSSLSSLSTSSGAYPVLYKFHYLDPKFVASLRPSSVVDIPPPEHEPALSCRYADGTPLNLSRMMMSFIQIMTEEQKMEEGKRMFSIFAARMFEQRVLQAYREKVAQERQMQLLRELEDEDKLTKEREQKKQSANQRKKDKKRLVYLTFSPVFVVV